MLVQLGEEGRRDRLAEHVLADDVGQPGARPERLDVVRVLHEPDVEHEVGLERHAVLVAEADQLDGRAGPRPGRRRGGRRSARAARAGRARSCRARRRPRRGPGRAARARAAIERAIPRSSASGWRWRVSEKRRIRTSSRASRKMITGPDPPPLQRAAHGAERERDVAGAHVEDDRGAREPQRVAREQVREVREQLAGQVVHDDVAEVLEQLRGRRLAAAGQPGDDDDLLRPARRSPSAAALAGPAGPSPAGSPSIAPRDPLLAAAPDEEDRALEQQVHRPAEHDRADDVAARA